MLQLHCKLVWLPFHECQPLSFFTLVVLRSQHQAALKFLSVISFFWCFLHILHRILVTQIVPLFLSDSISIQSPHFQLKSVDFLVFRSDLASMDALMPPCCLLHLLLLPRWLCKLYKVVSPFANPLKRPKLHVGLNYARKPQANALANARLGYFVGVVVGNFMNFMEGFTIERASFK